MRRNLLRERWQQLPERVVRQLQAEQLRRYLRSVVLPFSAYYREQFRQLGLDGDSIRTLDDLQRLPFTTKTDLLNTSTHPQKAREFVVIPDEQVLARRPSTVLRALLRGRNRVKKDFEAEFRPMFLTFTTGRSAEPTPFLYTQHDIENLTIAARRMVEICTTQADDRLLNASNGGIASYRRDVHGDFQRYIPIGAFDYKSGAGQLGGSPRTDEKIHVLAGLKHPAAKISADGTGADHENTHLEAPCYFSCF